MSRKLTVYMNGIYIGCPDIQDLHYGFTKVLNLSNKKHFYDFTSGIDQILDENNTSTEGEILITFCDNEGKFSHFNMGWKLENDEILLNIESVDIWKRTKCPLPLFILSSQNNNIQAIEQFEKIWEIVFEDFKNAIPNVEEKFNKVIVGNVYNPIVDPTNFENIITNFKKEFKAKIMLLSYYLNRLEYHHEIPQKEETHNNISRWFPIFYSKGNFDWWFQRVKSEIKNMEDKYYLDLQKLFELTQLS